MTPLDVHSPDGATLEQVLYAENEMLGDNNDSHKLSNYCDPGNNGADNDGS